MRHLLAFLFLVTPAVACEKSTDCAHGSKCMRHPANVLGPCIGGMSPGKDYDLSPAFNLDSPKEGNTCRKASECGGLKCFKDGQVTLGVCL